MMHLRITRNVASNSDITSQSITWLVTLRERIKTRTIKRMMRTNPFHTVQIVMLLTDFCKIHKYRKYITITSFTL